MRATYWLYVVGFEVTRSAYDIWLFSSILLVTYVFFPRVTYEAQQFSAEDMWFCPWFVQMPVWSMKRICRRLSLFIVMSLFDEALVKEYLEISEQSKQSAYY